MLTIGTNSVCALIMSIAEFYVVKKLLNSDEKIFKIKNVILLLPIILFATMFYTIKYHIIYTLLIFLLATITFKFIFNRPLHQIIIATGISTIILIVSDMISGFIYIYFFKLNQLRSI